MYFWKSSQYCVYDLYFGEVKYSNWKIWLQSCSCLLSYFIFMLKYLYQVIFIGQTQGNCEVMHILWIDIPITIWYWKKLIDNESNEWNLNFLSTKHTVNCAVNLDKFSVICHNRINSFYIWIVDSHLLLLYPW